MSETDNMPAEQLARVWALKVALDATVGRDIDASDTILMARYIETGKTPYEDTAEPSSPVSVDEMRSHP